MQVTKQEVLLVIPTFRPTRSVISIIEKLKLTTIVSDDCSPVTSDPILREISALPRTTVIRNLHNQGIARGLNQGLEFAASHQFEWLLTVDQDSDLDGDYARAILSAAQSHEALWIQRPAVGVIAPHQIQDASGVMTYPTKLVDSVPVTQEVIQSGALWRVSSLLPIGGFYLYLVIYAFFSASFLHLLGLSLSTSRCSIHVFSTVLETSFQY